MVGGSVVAGEKISSGIAAGVLGGKSIGFGSAISIVSTTAGGPVGMTRGGGTSRSALDALRSRVDFGFEGSLSLLDGCWGGNIGFFDFGFSLSSKGLALAAVVFFGDTTGSVLTFFSPSALLSGGIVAVVVELSFFPRGLFSVGPVGPAAFSPEVTWAGFRLNVKSSVLASVEAASSLAASFLLAPARIGKA